MFAIRQARKPLILRDFLKSSVSPFVPHRNECNSFRFLLNKKLVTCFTVLSFLKFAKSHAVPVLLACKRAHDTSPCYQLLRVARVQIPLPIYRKNIFYSLRQNPALCFQLAEFFAFKKLIRTLLNACYIILRRVWQA